MRLATYASSAEITGAMLNRTPRMYSLSVQSASCARIVVCQR